jgi:hypothetical protein
MIPRRVRVVARPCGVRVLNARTHGREQVRAEALERGGPRPRGGSGPRARRTSPEGAPRCATLVGRGGHHGVDRVVRVC